MSNLDYLNHSIGNKGAGIINSHNIEHTTYINAQRAHIVFKFKFTINTEIFFNEF